jgi:hypothetical protein
LSKTSPARYKDKKASLSYLPVRRRKKELFCKNSSARKMAVLTANHLNYFTGPILKRAFRAGVLGGDQDFTSLFGISVNICSVVWNLCDFPIGIEPIHLLWAFLFLKVYGTEPVLIAIVGGPTRKTFRKCAWSVIDEVATNARLCGKLLLLSHYQQKNILIKLLSIYFSLFLQIRWENRFGRDQGKT